MPFLNFHKANGGQPLSYRLEGVDAMGRDTLINFTYSVKMGKYVIGESRVGGEKVGGTNRIYEAWVDESSASGYISSLVFLAELAGDSDKLDKSYEFQHRTGLAIPTDAQIEHFTNLVLPTLAIVEAGIKAE